MDNLISHIKSRFAHESAKKLLKEKYQAKMIFAYAGGMWKAGPELLTLLHACPVADEIVIMDLYENPVKINPIELQFLVLQRWQEQMNAWLVEFEQNNTKR